MLKAGRLARPLGLLALAMFTACNSDPTTGVAVLSVTANPRPIDGRGTASLLTVEARDARGQPGTGQVTLLTAAGAFSDGTKQTVLTLANGIAGIGYICNSTTDGLCAGQVRIDAAWGQIAYSLLLPVGNSVSDGGTPDGGGGPISIGYLTLSASKSPIFFNVGDSSNITAQLSADAGMSLAGQTVGFSTNLGAFTLPDGGLSSMVNATTDNNGQAGATFRDNGTAGTATIVATHTPSSSIASMSLPIISVQAVSWVSTRCGGANCTIMGLRGSGFNEQATVTFKVVDSSNLPAPGVRVSFSLTSPPAGVTVTPTGTTDSNGLVSTNISVGTAIGVFTVVATVIPNQVQINSPPIGLRGAKASNQGMVVDCTPHNIAAYVNPQPPADLPSVCRVTLVDRFGNPVGTGAAVNFKSEAGVIPPTVSTVAFNPSAPDPAEGTAVFTFRSGGPFYGFLQDVPPLAALPNQYPFPRYTEPSWQDGSLVRNPRDGLVSILAYTQGEEWFDDRNGNGVWDPGERFIDQGEPLLDSNDNGVWDAGEFFVDLNGNGRWDPPNGIHDSNTTIWTETRILYTSRPTTANNNSYLSPSPFTPCPNGVPRGGFVYLDAFFGDLNMNVPQSSGTAFSVGPPPARGSVSASFSSLLDGYGFQMSRILVDASSQLACNPNSSLICNWKLVFGGWGSGYVGSVRVNGGTPSDPAGCITSNVQFDATVLQVITSAFATGGFQ